MVAFMHSEEAYDISLFETEDVDIEEKETERDIALEKDSQAAKKKKVKVQAIVKGSAVGMVVVSLIGCIICGQVQLTELNQQISASQTELEEKQSVYIQSQMKVEAKYSSDIVEESAQGQLGMSRADSYQKEYISLSEGDKAEVTNAGGSNIFETIANAIAGLWS